MDTPVGDKSAYSRERSLLSAQVPPFPLKSMKGRGGAATTPARPNVGLIIAPCGPARVGLPTRTASGFLPPLDKHVCNLARDLAIDWENPSLSINLAKPDSRHGPVGTA